MLIGRNSNFERDRLKESFPRCVTVNNVLDLGAGKGTDLLNTKSVIKRADLIAIKNHPTYVQHLKSSNVQVHPLNIENVRLPIANKAIGQIVINQILEHVKEVILSTKRLLLLEPSSHRASRIILYM